MRLVRFYPQNRVRFQYVHCEKIWHPDHNAYRKADLLNSKQVEGPQQPNMFPRVAY